LWRNH